VSSSICLLNLVIENPWLGMSMATHLRGLSTSTV
jgi:hypothetical protein